MKDDIPWLSQVTAIIKAFERPCCVARLVISIKRYYPSLRVLVCDDSRVPLYQDGAEPLPGVTWYTLPFELGHTLGAGRNFLIDRAQTEYVFLCDDDQEFLPGTRLRAMWKFLESSGYDIVAGAQDHFDYGAAIFKRKNDKILVCFDAHHGLVAPRVVACDRVHNTFLARTESLRRIRWHEKVYAREHTDFFIRAYNAGLKIAQMGGTRVGHDRSCEPRRGFLGKILGTIMYHRDQHYRMMRWGAEANAGTREAMKKTRDLYETHILTYHGVSAIVDKKSLRRQFALYRLIGWPADTISDDCF
jgi:hypothetical protein